MKLVNPQVMLAVVSAYVVRSGGYWAGGRDGGARCETRIRGDTHYGEQDGGVRVVLRRKHVKTS